MKIEKGYRNTQFGLSIHFPPPPPNTCVDGGYRLFGSSRFLSVRYSLSCGCNIICIKNVALSCYKLLYISCIVFIPTGHTDKFPGQGIPPDLRAPGTDTAGPARQTTHRGELLPDARGERRDDQSDADSGEWYRCDVQVCGTGVTYRCVVQV